MTSPTPAQEFSNGQRLTVRPRDPPPPPEARAAPKPRPAEHEWQQSTARVAVFFGTFDPVHENHIAMAKHAIAAHAICHVVFVPAPDFRFKPFVSLLRDRIELLQARLALENTPELGTILSVHTDLRPNQATLRVCCGDSPDRCRA